MIDKKEYQSRRLQLAKQISKDAIAFIPAATEIIRNGDAHYQFRQDSDFYYLTGFNEPDCLLLIMGGTGETILFSRPTDPIAEIWTGKRLGQDNAKEVLGVDVAYSIDTLEVRLPELLAGKKNIYCLIDRYPYWREKILTAWRTLKGMLRRGVIAPEVLQDISSVLGEMRLFKSPKEVHYMTQAAEISIKAHEKAMHLCKPGLFEYELEAALLYEFKKGGCNSIAYNPIVASGEQACILHYTDNNKLLRDGDLVLIDAGGEYSNYAADITRTFPVNGHFSSEQRVIYELVLSAQRAGMQCIKPGVAWNKIQETIVGVLTQGLIDLKILTGNLDTLMEQEAYKPFYMHNSGHWLGLDVHDVGQYKVNNQWRALEAGMVLTVEPGLYIRKDKAKIDPRWWGIGVRIEDDILVTTDGFKNLTEALAVNIDKIEALIGP